jgi:hypothetical protein
MSLKLKMFVTSVLRNADYTGDISSENISLSAVYGPVGTVNAEWSKSTPRAEFTMTITNKQAFGKLLPGQFYFIDLIPTDKDS